MHPRRIEDLAKRDRVIVGGALSILILLTWLYTIRASVSMQYMDAEFAFTMWAVMMVAMMTPTVTPMLFVFSRMSRSPGFTIAFLLGYLVLWTAFGALAAVLQGVLARAGVVSSMAVSTNRYLNAALLLSTGVYQFLPWKHACLSKCRTPLGFLLTEWRDGWHGALIMGLRHGLYCTGCCWLLMALLFVGGAMNLTWITVLTLIVLLEKIIPLSSISKQIGAAAVLGGAWFLLSG